MAAWNFFNEKVNWNLDATDREGMQHLLIEAETRKIEAELEKLKAEQRLVKVKGTVHSILLIGAAVAGLAWVWGLVK